MNIIPETKKSIKIGIIVALITMILFVYFIQPILSICGKLFINVFSKVFSAYTDNVFRQAATISPEKPAFTLLTFILSLYAGIIVGFYVAIMVRYISVIRKKESDKKEFNESNNSGKKENKESFNFDGYFSNISVISYYWRVLGSVVSDKNNNWFYTAHVCLSSLFIRRRRRIVLESVGSDEK